MLEFHFFLIELSYSEPGAGQGKNSLEGKKALTNEILVL